MDTSINYSRALIKNAFIYVPIHIRMIAWVLMKSVTNMNKTEKKNQPVCAAAQNRT